VKRRERKMKQQKKKVYFGIFIPLILLAILFIFFIQSDGLAQANNISRIPTSTDPILASLNEQIKRDDAFLNNRNTSIEDKKKIEVNKKFLQTEAAQREKYINNLDVAVKIKLTVIAELTTTPQPTVNIKLGPTPTGGLISEFYAPKYREANFSTLWISYSEKGKVMYFAGNLVKDPDQGVIYIEREDGKTVEKYSFPNKEGSLKLLKVENNYLYLTSKKGKDYIFNLEKKEFMNELGKQVLEFTPTPGPGYPPPK
jgi:hypothetical protein